MPGASRAVRGERAEAADAACSTAAAASSNAVPATARLIRRADKRDQIFSLAASFGLSVRTRSVPLLKRPPLRPWLRGKKPEAIQRGTM